MCASTVSNDKFSETLNYIFFVFSYFRMTVPRTATQMRLYVLMTKIETHHSICRMLFTRIVWIMNSSFVFLELFIVSIKFSLPSLEFHRSCYWLYFRIIICMSPKQSRHVFFALSPMSLNDYILRACVFFYIHAAEMLFFYLF